MTEAPTRALYAHLTELEDRLELASQCRNRSERRLRRLEKALDTMQIGVTVTNVERKIVYTNPADARMHGYEVEELVGRDVSVFSCPNDRRPLPGEQLGRVRSWRRESFNLRKDGTVFPVELTSDVVLDGEDKPLGIVTSCQDISERRETEQALLDSREALDDGLLAQARQLSAANRRLQDEISRRERLERERRKLEEKLRQLAKLEAIGQLTSGIAHDFNNLLAVINGNAELLAIRLPADAHELRQSLADIQEAGQSGAKMIEQLLGYSRRADLDLAPADLAQVVGDTTAMLRWVVRSDLVIQTHADRAVPPVTVDQSSVQQMLLNLVTNARDAMPSGGTIRIVVSSEQVTEAHRVKCPWLIPGPYVCIAVADTGLGMDRETLDRVFEPFFTTKSRGEGTGLGLAMVYGLMKQHSGYVHIDSEPGEGTTVQLFFPVSADQSQSPSPTVASSVPASGSETILVAEDEGKLRQTARRALEHCGYDVLTASDGLEALDVFREHRDRIRLILSDLVMPNMGGRDLYDAVRRQDREVRFLFTTGYDRETGNRAGIADSGQVIKKPWKLRELASRVREALDEGVQYT